MFKEVLKGSGSAQERVETTSMSLDKVCKVQTQIKGSHQVMGVCPDNEVLCVAKRRRGTLI